MADPALRLRRFWDRHADDWTRAVRSNGIASRDAGTDAAIVEAVLRGLPPRGRVLDVGCGEGWLVRALDAVGVEARGVDGSAALVEAARQAGGRFGVLDFEAAAADPARLGPPVDVAVFNFALLSDDVTGILRAAARRSPRVVLQTLHPTALDPPYADGWREEPFAGVDGVFEPMPWYGRTFASWVRTLDAAGLRLAEAMEPLHPETGAPLSLLLVAETR